MIAFGLSIDRRERKFYRMEREREDGENNVTLDGELFPLFAFCFASNFIVGLSVLYIELGLRPYCVEISSEALSWLLIEVYFIIKIYS